MREIRRAKDGYLFTEIADVPIEVRTWAKVKDSADFSTYHEVPIDEYETWCKKIEELENGKDY